MTSFNPYITGDSVGNRSAFVGRDDILNNVLTVVRDQNNAIVLYGQRRIGKTSVLQVLETQLSEEEACLPVFFDFQDKAQLPVEQLLGELAYKISDGLNQATPNLGADPSATFFKWLAAKLNNLPTDISKLVLLFDEFDVLADPESAQAGASWFPELHKLLNINKKCLNIIFVIGRKVDELSNVTIALFGNIAAQQVSLLKHDDIVKLTRLSETNKSLYWSNDTVEAVWQLTSGHPFLTQCLCYHVWERLCCRQTSDEPPIVRLTDVPEAIPDTLIFSRNTLESLWRGLPSAAQIVASALAGAGAGGMSKAELDNLLSKGGVQKVIRELNEAPCLLVNWDIIEEIDGSYRFRVELIRCWVAEYKSFDEALDLALNQANPDADKLYKHAQELYEEKLPDDALKLLRSALQKLSAHVKANQLLADILIEQNNYGEARNLLEKLYEFQPVAAQSRLIQALLALAKSNNSDDEQLKLYQRILAIDPKHPEARGERQQILDNQNAKRQKWINTIKGIYEKLSKRMWQFLGFIFALVVSYYWLTVRIPTDPLIVLEVGQPANDVSEYTITGVVSDKPYWLDTVKILPHCDHPVKQATFKYDIYKGVDLKVNPNTQPPTYWVDKALLQQTLAEKDQPFSFEFLDKERFTFSFQFEAPETTLAEFECQVFTADNRNVPCQVREKGYLSLFRGIPWFGISSILGIILIVLIEIVYAFKKRKKGPTIIY